MFSTRIKSSRFNIQTQVHFTVFRTSIPKIEATNLLDYVTRSLRLKSPHKRAIGGSGLRVHIFFINPTEAFFSIRNIPLKYVILEDFKLSLQGVST